MNCMRPKGKGREVFNKIMGKSNKKTRVRKSK